MPNRFANLAFLDVHVDCLNIVEVAEALLQYCQSEESAFRVAISNFTLRRFKRRARAWFRALFRQSDSTFSDYLARPALDAIQAFLDSDLDQFCRSFSVLGATSPWISTLPRLTLQAEDDDSWRNPIPKVVKARAIALALDDALNLRFPRAFRSYHEIRQPGFLELTPGMAFPCCQSGHHFPRMAYRTAATDDLVSHLPNLRLFPDGIPINLRLLVGDPFTPAFEAALTDRDSLTVSVACLGPVEFDENLHKYYTFERSQYRYDPQERPPEEGMTASGMGKFFDVRPNPSFVNIRILTGFLEKAEANKASICVLPELALSEALLQQLKLEFSQMQLVYVRILIAGSVHLNVDGRRKNRLHVFVRDQRGLSAFGHPSPTLEFAQCVFHDKIGTFCERFPDDSGHHYYLYEDIDRAQQLLMLLPGGGKPLCFAICKDLLQQSVLAALHAIGCRYLLVVALSPKTEEFIIHMSELATTDSTVSVLACTCTHGGVTAAISGPTRESTVTVIRNAEQPTPHPRKYTGVHFPPFTEVSQRVDRQAIAVFTSNPKANSEEPGVIGEIK